MKQLIHFDFTDAAGRPAPLRFVDPVEIIVASQPRDVLPALHRVQSATDAGYYAAGFVAYEAAPAFDSAMIVSPPSELPLLWFGLYAAPTPINEPEQADDSFHVGELTCPVDELRFRQQIASIRESISRGDFYQVNHTLRLRASFSGSAFAWYHQLRMAQRANYSACLDLGRFQILSLSPELFFHVDTSRRIVTRPMKGTHKRGRWPGEDRVFQRLLQNSEKERAENLMIVDLLRNDLGRIAETGTVNVEKLFEVERYPTLLQMTSTVSAQLRHDTALPEIFSALFPCGSVTGAPKIAAMQRIAALEPEPRQVYCGAIGYMEPGGSAIFSVAIRTVLIDKESGSAEYGVGSGVTWDSKAEAEYEENRLKAAVLRAPSMPPDLFETLRLQDGVYSRADRHLDRILASAGYFQMTADRGMLLDALERQANDRTVGLWRVRLVLSASGEIHTQCEPLDDPPDRPRTFALHPRPIDRNDPLLFHKVVDRSQYNRRKAERPDVHDVLLSNQQGELTEFTTGNLVLELDGERVTPPLDCGLLPGVLRAELLEAGSIVEGILKIVDLERATQVWLINSLRGWVPMVRT